MKELANDWACQLERTNADAILYVRDIFGLWFDESRNCERLVRARCPRHPELFHYNMNVFQADRSFWVSKVMLDPHNIA